jgi:hypothetical protein
MEIYCMGDYILRVGPPSNWANSLASTVLQVYNPPSMELFQRRATHKQSGQFYLPSSSSEIYKASVIKDSKT